MKYVTIVSRYILSILVLILSLGEMSCTYHSSQSDEMSSVTSTAEISLVEGWIILDYQIRDAQVFDSLVLLSNSAPTWGQGPRDGEPFIAAFDSRSQDMVWELKYAPIAPIVVNSQSLFVVDDSRLVAIDLNSGGEIWSVPFTSQGLSQVFSDDELVLAANRESLFAFNATSGELHWESDLPIPLDPFVPLVTSFTSWREHSALVKHDRTVYARRLDHHVIDECRFSLFALDAGNGSEKWRFSVRQSNLGECVMGTLPLMFDENLTIVATWKDLSGICTLSALNKDDGEVIWRYQATDSCFVRSFFLDGKFILISAKSMLVLEARMGDLLWQQEHSLGNPQQLLENRGWVIFLAGGTNEKTLSLVDLHTGEVLDQLRVPLPEKCRFASGIAGLSNDQVVLIVGNCIRLFNFSEEGRLQP